VRRRSGTGGEPVKARRRKTLKPKRRPGPKAVRRRSASAADHKARIAQLTRELSEALRQQAATADVLRVISRSPGDLQPVFDVMLKNARRICDAEFGNIYRWDGEALHLIASHNTPAAFAQFRKTLPFRPSATSLIGRMVTSKRFTHVADAADNPDYTERRDPSLIAAVDLGGVRTYLAVPMLKENELIGAVTVYRQEVRPFTDKQIALITSFADQAVVAVENTRLVSELRASKEHAEQALAELRNAQKNLIEAEKLAALGGLVAGIAHEINNPVGISLTVASSFAQRCELFSEELLEPPLRRSRLDEFVATSHAAANQLVANLQRAGELIQSFKQVAVDRSHADRRRFDLAEATDQIVASVRPELKKLPLSVTVEVPSGIAMDSYPGSYGQVLTNLFLNAVVHAYPDGQAGTLRLGARAVGASDVEITVADDGVGMSEEVRDRAFDPFFTTRRDRGGTGLGLHIIYNLVTQTLGGHLTMESAPGRGTSFRITIPRRARTNAAAAATDA
jgi:signal transduction histidine kinase